MAITVPIPNDCSTSFGDNMNNLYDIQLALVICRLYDEDMLSVNVKEILYSQILGCDKNGNNYDLDRVHADPFLRSMSLWSFKDFRGSLNTLLHDAKKQRMLDKTSRASNGQPFL
jgi:hypothetical protein